jgi:hypothetical protein
LLANPSLHGPLGSGAEFALACHRRPAYPWDGASDRRIQGRFSAVAADCARVVEGPPMRRCLALAPLVIVVVLAAARAAAAQDAPAGSLTDLTGEWMMEVAGHQMGLELEQSGSKVEGVMQAMGRRILLVGTYEGRTLSLKGERPEDGAGHIETGDAGPIVATMKDDGTLEGELSTNRGRTPWTGTRFKPRK